MRRAPWVVAATGVGLGLLLSYHTRPIGSASTRVAGTLPPGAGNAPTPTSPPAPTTSTAPANGPAGTGTPSTATPATTPPTTAAQRQSATGQDVLYAYGDLQLQVTEQGSRIVGIQVVADGARDPRSAQINSAALPILEQQALDAQSAQVDGVSGATFTSAAFVQALQSALDQLGG